MTELKMVLEQHRKWTVGAADGKRAYLRDANLRGADLSGSDLARADLDEADLGKTTLCGADIDGAILSNGAVSGPGHILCALTDEEWEVVQKGRGS